jgi:DNA-binding transcriptional MerR regulator
MQVSELVSATGIPLATVKYYLREGLLPAGRRITARSSEYGAEHVRRLALLRVLRDVGAIPVQRLRELVEAVETPRLSVHEMFARASDAIAAGARRDQESALVPTPEAVAMVDAVVRTMGWSHVRPEAVDLENLRRVVSQLLGTGLFELDENGLAFYARIADEVARAEIAALPEDDDRAAHLERMVVGTVAFGEILAILRRLAEEEHSAGRFAS